MEINRMAEIKGRSTTPNKSRTPSRTGLSRVTQQQANERPPFAEQEFPEQILARVDEAESPTRGFSVLLSYRDYVSLSVAIGIYSTVL
jgi:hypothetical protein